MANKKKIYDVVIIGSGAIGSFFAYELSKYNLEVMLCEAKPYLHSHYDENYHDVLWNGYEFADDNALSKSIIQGSKIWKETLIPLLTSPIQKINLMIPSSSDKATVLLHQYYQRSLIKNINKKDLKIIDDKLIQQKEPLINNKIMNSFFDKNVFLVDVKKALQNLIQIALANNLYLLKNAEITDISDAKNGFYIKVNGFKQFFTKSIINATGLNSNNLLHRYNETTIPLQYYQAYYLLLQQNGVKINNLWVDHFSKSNPFVPRQTVFENLNQELVAGVMINRNVLTKHRDQYQVPKIKPFAKAINQWFDVINADTIKNIYYRTYAGIKNNPDFYFNPMTNNKLLMNVMGYHSYGWIIAPYLAEVLIETWKKADFVMSRKDKKSLTTKTHLIW